MPGKSKPDMCFFPRDSTFSISALPGVGKPMLLTRMLIGELCIEDTTKGIKFFLVASAKMGHP